MHRDGTEKAVAKRDELPNTMADRFCTRLTMKDTERRSQSPKFKVIGSERACSWAHTHLSREKTATTWRVLGKSPTLMTPVENHDTSHQCARQKWQSVF
jgi:hypothetical protein